MLEFGTARDRLRAVLRRIATRNRVFGGDRRGGVALTFALSSTVLLGLVGGGIDYARIASRRAQLQNAVDVGVLSGGNTMKLAASSIPAVEGVTEQAIRSSAPPRLTSPSR
ncbi:TadE/TadG family type IV pilus assembly protein [Methylobacterium phyllosphaerae]